MSQISRRLVVGWLLSLGGGALAAQPSPDSVARARTAALLVPVATLESAQDARAAAESAPASSDHAVRDGAWIGAAAGFLIEAVDGPPLEAHCFGYGFNTCPHVRRSVNAAVIEPLAGAAFGAGIGAGIGAVVHHARGHALANMGPLADSAAPSPSHAVRNGAFAGAAFGLLAGVVPAIATSGDVGCPVSSASGCDRAAYERNVTLTLGAVGAATGALIGAGVGELVRLAHEP